MTKFDVVVSLAIIAATYLLKLAWALSARRKGVASTVLGLPLHVSDPLSELRGMGWDLAAASWGFFAVALATPTSKFGTIFAEAGGATGDGHWVTVAYFLIYATLFVAASWTRHVLVVSAERAERGLMRAGLVNWVAGAACLYPNIHMALG